jgi:hypothetical protein
MVRIHFKLHLFPSTAKTGLKMTMIANVTTLAALTKNGSARPPAPRSKIELVRRSRDFES